MVLLVESMAGTVPRHPATLTTAIGPGAHGRFAEGKNLAKR